MRAPLAGRPESTTISGLLKHLRAAPPARIALHDEARRVTYGELPSLVRGEARWLAGSGERFALLAENGCAWALADLALHEGGLLSVPLPSYFTPGQLRHAIGDAGIDSVLTDQPRRVQELDLSFATVGCSPRSGLTLLRRERGASDSRPELPVGTIKVTYTSGSTAAPKGVCLSAPALENVARSLAAVTAPLGIERHLCLMPLPTLLENVAGLHAALLCGASCHLPSMRVTGMSYAGVDAEKLLRAVADARPQSLILVPEVLRLLLQAADRGWPAPASLKLMAVGGAQVPQEVLARATHLGLPVFQGYGLSECASVVCLNTPGANRIGSVGRPLPHAQVRRDDRGQLLVRGAVMSGYLGDRRTGPAREIATGDLGEIDADGYVYIQGRARNVFITSLGRNVSPEWIERELTTETTIRHALAFGEARPYIVALIAKARSDVDSESIARAVERANGRLPSYARVMRWAVLPEAPTLANGLLTANGRLRREQLLARFGALIDTLYDARTTVEKA